MQNEGEIGDNSGPRLVSWRPGKPLAHPHLSMQQDLRSRNTITNMLENEKRIDYCERAIPQTNANDNVPGQAVTSGSLIEA